MTPRCAGWSAWSFLSIIGAIAAADAHILGLKPGPQLLVDDYLIEQAVGLVRTVHQPERVSGPIISPQAWYVQPKGQVVVLYDSDLRRFRMWFVAIRATTQSGAFYAYAESEDGVTWCQPNLGLTAVDGSSNNNALFNRADCIVLVDRGRDYAEREKRYVLIKLAKIDRRKALWAKHSADGIHFVDHPKNPVYLDPPGGRVDDALTGNWDPLQQRFLLNVGYDGFVEDGYPRAPVIPGTSSEPSRVKPKNTGVGQFWSHDLSQWSEFRRTLTIDPDAPDADQSIAEQLNPGKPFVRGGLYLGMLLVKRDDLPAHPGGPLQTLGWTELCTSRDGENWIRQPGTFFDRNRQRETWDHDMAWVRDCVTVGDREFLYYHGVERNRRGLGVAMLRKNGFVSRDAGPDGGVLLTRLFTLEGNALTVNAKVNGELRIRVLNSSGLPVRGFSRQDCEPLRGDLIDKPVRWKGNLGSLQGYAVRLEFSLRDAQLYGFQIATAN